jgi:hypothetical protein
VLPYHSNDLADLLATTAFPTREGTALAIEGSREAASRRAVMTFAHHSIPSPRASLRSLAFALARFVVGIVKQEIQKIFRQLNPKYFKYHK